MKLMGRLKLNDYFDVNGAIIRFDDTKNNYNKIRKIFKLYALEISKNFERDCLNSFQNLKQISDRGLSLGEKYIEESFKKGIETIVSFGIITIDIDTFKSVYCEKYLDFKRLFNNLNKTFIIPNKNKKKWPRELLRNRIDNKENEQLFIQ